MASKKRGASALAEAAATMADAAATAAENEAADIGRNGVHVVGYGPDEDEPVFNLGPLFQLPADKKARHARTRVYRDEPIEEGHVGNISPEDTEEAIARRWGGTVFHLEAVDEHGQFIARRSGIKIAAEPKFTSKLGRKRYRAWLEGEFSENDDDDKDERPAAATVTPIRNAEDQSALEADRHARELGRIRAEAEAYQMRAKADLELAVARARAESEASIARVRAESEEREKRDRAFYEAQIKQQAEWMQITRAQEKSADPMQQLKVFSSIMSDLRSDSDNGHAPDVATAIVERLPEILGAVDQVSGGAGRSSAAAKKGSATAKEPVTLTDSLADKARAAARHLASQGVKNPSVALSQQIERSLDRVLQTRVVEGDNKAKPAPKKITSGKPRSKK